MPQEEQLEQAKAETAARSYAKELGYDVENGGLQMILFAAFFHQHMLRQHSLNADALREYVQHKEHCRIIRWQLQLPENDHECTCGLNDLLNSKEQ